MLHSTGHVRAIKQQFPDSNLTLLTADTSIDIFQHNPWVDEIISFQRYRVKDSWWRHPVWTYRHFRETIKRVRKREYDLAIDLQGRWKSVLFLYCVRAKSRYVKGNWPLLKGYRDKHLHALREMDRVLEIAGIRAEDTHMEFAIRPSAPESMQQKLRECDWNGEACVVISPFTRWPSKNWALSHYAELILQLPRDVATVITGAASDRQRVDTFLKKHQLNGVINLCGVVDLQEFAALVENAVVLVSGDSFAMHLAVACNTPVIALFGPTSESRVGPGSEDAVILRAGVNCERCYRRDCRRRCIDDIAVSSVLDQIKRFLSVDSTRQQDA